MTEKRDNVADKLLERKLVSTRDEALALADKFLEMDVRAEAPKVAGSELESAQNAEAAYEQVLYYERIALVKSEREVFANARTSEPAPAAPAPTPAQSAQNEALERLHKTEVDLSQMFNVDNMRKAQES